MTSENEFTDECPSAPDGMHHFPLTGPCMYCKADYDEWALLMDLAVLAEEGGNPQPMEALQALAADACDDVKGASP